MPTICGIDPGYRKGALAFVSLGLVKVYDLPVFIQGGVDVKELARILAEHGPAHAYIEHVHAMPRQGVSSTFKFGLGNGQIQATVALCGIPYSLVTPTKWKRFFRFSKDKDQSRKRAIELYPELSADLARKKDADRAEALLIARYGEKVEFPAGA